MQKKSRQIFEIKHATSTVSRLSPVCLVVLGVLSTPSVYALDVDKDTPITNQTITDGVHFTAPDITVDIDGGSTITGGSNPVTFNIADGESATLNVSGEDTSINGSSNGIWGNNAQAQITVSDGASITGGYNGISLGTGSSLSVSGASTIVTGTTRDGVAIDGGNDITVDVNSGATVTGAVGVRTDADNTTINVSGQGTSVIGTSGSGIIADAQSSNTTINVDDGATVTGTTGITFNASDSGSSINIDSGTVTGTNGNGINIGTTGNWTGEINISSSSTVSGTDNGVRTDASGSTINVSGQGTSVSGINSGIIADAESSNTTINISDGAEVSGNTAGVKINDGDSATVNIAGASVAGKEKGIYLYNGTDTTINISDGATVTGDDAIYVYGFGDNISVTGGSTITGSSSGIRLDSVGNNTTLLISDSTVQATAGDGIFTYAGDLSGNTITVTDGAIVTGSDDGIDTHHSMAADITISGTGTQVSGGNTGVRTGDTDLDGPGSNVVLRVSDGALVHGDDTGIVTSEAGSGTVEIDLSSGAGVSGGVTGINASMTPNTTINIAGATVTAGVTGILLTDNNQLNISAGALINSDNAIVLAGNADAATVDITDSTINGTTSLLAITGQNATNNVSFTNSIAYGAITSASDAAQTVSMDHTAWSGSASQSGTGALNLKIGNASAWVNTADTSVSSVTLSGGSALTMDGGNINTTTLSDGSSSSTPPLAATDSAASTIYSTWNAAAGSAYVLTADTAIGTFNTGVTSSSSGAAGDMTGDTIIHVDDASGATFNAMQSDVGVYRYQTATVENADGSTSVILDNISPGPTISTAAQAVVDTRAAAVSLWNDEQDALNLRMDNERRTGSSDGTLNAWGSYYGGYHRQQMNMASSSYDQTNNGFMVGADKRVGASSGEWLFGAAVMRGFSDVNMHDEGSVGSDIDSYGASIYASYRMNNGLFLDANLKGTHLKNDLSVVSVDGGKTSGDYSTNGFGGAFKGGYHLALRSFYIEPYTQVSYARYNGVDYSLENGMRAKDDDYTSVRLEGGANIGTSVALHNGAEIRPYLHLAAAGETENDNTMNINGVNIDDSTDGAEGIVGLGTDVKFTKNLSSWAGANYAKGQDNNESPWQLNAGISYTW